MRLVSQKEARNLFGGRGSVLSTLVKRWAPRRPSPIEVVPGRALAPSSELQEWMRLYAEFELETVDPGEAELRVPPPTLRFEDLLDPTDPGWVAEIVGLFTASAVVVQQEAMSFLASWTAAKDGASRVYYFHPGDWGVWPTDASIAGRLFRVTQEEDREAFLQLRQEGEAEARWVSALKLYEATHVTPLPDKSDPAALFGRCEWIVGALTGAGRTPAAALERAAPLARFLEESDLIPRLPHIALYWLWSHFLLGNAHELDVTLSLTEPLRDPVIQDVRRWMQGWRAGLPSRLGPLEAAHFHSVREQIADEAPVEMFGPERRRRVLEERAEELSEREAEARLRAPLDEAAVTEPAVERALRLMDHLGRGGAVPPAPIENVGVTEAMQELADLVDPRFRELVRLRLRKSALHGDGHKEAGWGLILAWAALASDLDEFEAVLAEAGTARFGPRRRAELYRAYARFDDHRATEVLAHAADRWLTQVDDWIRMEPAEAVQMLLARDAIETHRFIAKLLERARFTFANVDICVEAARSAGRLRSTRAVAGLRRAVVERLGRVGDGGRTDVHVALALVEGRDAAEFLCAHVEQYVRQWEDAVDDDDAWQAQVQLACCVAGALPAAPDNERLLELTRTLAANLEPRLASPRPPSPETIEMATALCTAAAVAEDRGLARRCARWSGTFKRTRGNARAAARFDAARSRIHDDVL